MTTPTKTEAVLQILRQYGPMTSSKLAVRSGLDQQYVANLLRKIRKSGRYGVRIKGKTPSPLGTGVAHNVWEVDEQAYEHYLKHRDVRAYKAGLASLRNRPGVLALIPKTAYRTTWQPTSPYYRGDTR